MTVLAVAPHPIYDTQHELVTRLCRVASEQSAVSTFGEGAARVGWLMECPSYPGNSGSPVLDGAGRLRALVHAGSASVQGIGISSVTVQPPRTPGFPGGFQRGVRPLTSVEERTRRT